MPDNQTIIDGATSPQCKPNFTERRIGDDYLQDDIAGQLGREESGRVFSSMVGVHLKCETDIIAQQLREKRYLLGMKLEGLKNNNAEKAFEHELNEIDELRRQLRK
jgi:hypothetical protein